MDGCILSGEDAPIVLVCVCVCVCVCVFVCVACVCAFLSLSLCARTHACYHVCACVLLRVCLCLACLACVCVRVLSVPMSSRVSACVRARETALGSTSLVERGGSAEAVG